MSNGPKVVNLHEPTWRDVPTVLRNLLESIEAGTYGEAQEVAIVLHSEAGMVLFAGGKRASIDSSHMLHTLATRALESMRMGRQP